jgi:hypothetical protein
MRKPGKLNHLEKALRSLSAFSNILTPATMTAPANAPCNSAIADPTKAPAEAPAIPAPPLVSRWSRLLN